MMSCQKPNRLPKPAIKVYPDGREVCNMSTPLGRGEYFGRLGEMVERQMYVCALCPSDDGAYFDHEAGRGAGGGLRDDRIVVDGHWQNAALCYSCNQEKGSKRYHWVDGEYVPCKTLK